MDELMEIDRQVFTGDEYWGVRLRDFVNRSHAHAIYSKEKTIPTGFVVYMVLGSWSKVVHIAKVGVVPSYRRRGIARALMNNAIQRARDDHRATSVTLFVKTTNEPAMTLYTSLGFQTESLIEDYYGDGVHAYKMRYTLTP